MSLVLCLVAKIWMWVEVVLLTPLASPTVGPACHSAHTFVLLPPGSMHSTAPRPPSPRGAPPTPFLLLPAAASKTTPTPCRGRASSRTRAGVHASARSRPPWPRLLPHPCRRPASTRSRPLGTRLCPLLAADAPPPAPTPAARLRHDQASVAPHRPRVTERRRRASGLGWSAQFGRTIPTRI